VNQVHAGTMLMVLALAASHARVSIAQLLRCQVECVQEFQGASCEETVTGTPWFLAECESLVGITCRPPTLCLMSTAVWKQVMGTTGCLVIVNTAHPAVCTSVSLP
jgi:hypothetical protein